MKSQPNGFSRGRLVFSGHVVFIEDFPGHLGRIGKQGGSLPRGAHGVTRAELDDPVKTFGYDPFEAVDSAVLGKLKDAIVKSNLTKNELSGARFSTNPPAEERFCKYVYPEDPAEDNVFTGFVLEGPTLGGPMRKSGDVVGVYDSNTQTVHLPKGFVRDGVTQGLSLGAILIHEIAHHISDRWETVGRDMYLNSLFHNHLCTKIKNQIHKTVAEGDKEGFDQALSEDFGLRDYSIGRAGELFPDMFMVSKMGTDRQKQNLLRLTEEVRLEYKTRKRRKRSEYVSKLVAAGPITRLSQIFEAAGGKKIRVFEIRSEERGGMEALVPVPVTISAAQYKATPWYYAKRR